MEMAAMRGTAPSPFPAVERRITPDGTAYVEQGSGEPLVLVHGVGMRLEAWWPQIESLSASHRVIAVDMPGHGQSLALPKGSELPDFVAWLGGFLQEMKLEPVNLAGHSMGALIAGGAVASFPQKIRRVALVNGVYRRDVSAKAAVLARAESIAADGIDIEGPLKRWFDTDAVSLAARALTEQCLRQMNVDAYATAYRAFANGDETYADCWPQVSCPALFLTGAGDPNSTAEMAQTMAGQAQQGIARIVPGHRHMVNLTAPQEVHNIMAAWLALPEAHP
ncbi:alpha/beta fold hydrolase [Agrobacterium vitis]|uniref:alpha/beta fold hydrolase n=1 Tax=Agrobacterium vitis TaxID=373 RepID=UPI0015727B70|nr:alpha/beta hydrolase [Agrobacterium vitis]NSZ19267.1 alpha/beta hydrolase [Agrobacterium vitis]QZO06138.1 alpha/beta hydrolase [Agrobacterium vitis]UJL90461.1 alpha/beta hydrolase [Agrobacterium vitis]